MVDSLSTITILYAKPYCARIMQIHHIDELLKHFNIISVHRVGQPQIFIEKADTTFGEIKATGGKKAEPLLTLPFMFGDLNFDYVA